jgi:hypothetical protein
MSQHSLRNWMKYGPFMGLYTHIRRIKRRMRQQPYQHIERFSPEPLRAADEEDRGKGQVESQGAERLALACLRCAETCKMEASERIQLYRALVEARLGDTEYARRLAEPLDPAELTASECILREHVLRESLPDVTNQTQPAALSWKGAGARIHSINPDSMLVIEDEQAITATWAKDADYLLAAKGITGLTLEAVASFRRQFSVCIGSTDDQKRAQEAGIECEEWVTLPSEVGEGIY